MLSVTYKFFMLSVIIAECCGAYTTKNIISQPHPQILDQGGNDYLPQKLYVAQTIKVLVTACKKVYDTGPKTYILKTIYGRK